MNILIAPNAFKECAGQIEIASLINSNFETDAFRSTVIPLSDGGDGFLEVCKQRFHLTEQVYEIPAPFDGAKIACKVGWKKDKSKIFIESADILGLKIVPINKRNPILLDSKGLGVLLKTIMTQESSLNNIVIGIGGTATNDLGLGAASIFGLKLLDDDGKYLPIIPRNYELVKDLIWEQPRIVSKIEIITDVENPLLGENGAARSFARQKGASEKDIEIMESGFENIIKILRKKKLGAITNILNGAGGGLAAGMQIFFNAIIKPASDFIFEDLGINNLSYNPDIIITGEGAFDSQTLMKKASGILIEKFRNSGARIFIICGISDPEIENKLPANVKIFPIIKYFKDEKESKKNYKMGIKMACNEIKRIIGHN